MEDNMYNRERPSKQEKKKLLALLEKGSIKKPEEQQYKLCYIIAGGCFEIVTIGSYAICVDTRKEKLASGRYKIGKLEIKKL